jgi:aldose sugar dehydrogenase
MSISIFGLIVLVLVTFLLSHTFNLAHADNAQYKPRVFNSSASVNDPTLKVSTIATGLNFPTSMAFLGPNDILVTEKNNGTILRIINGTVQPKPILDLSVATRAERGLLGIAISNGDGTDKAKNNFRYVFVYFTNSTEGKDSDGELQEKSGGNILYRFEFNDGKLINPDILLKINTSEAYGAAHNGGSMIIGPDGNLYIPIGDGDRHNTEAQNIPDAPPDGTGGILTFDLNGLPVKNILGNSGPKAKYYAYGVRNSFGIDFDPVTGQLWDTENGDHSNDEINLVLPGFNSGWFKLQGKAPSNFNYSELVNFDGKGEYSDPEFVWNRTIGPTKILFLDTPKLGSKYQNDLFVSDVKYGRIYHFKLNQDRNELILSGKLADKVADFDRQTKGIIFGSNFGGITDMVIGPDGYLYVLSFGQGTIFKISPK